jgi:hypothetical protein
LQIKSLLFHLFLLFTFSYIYCTVDNWVTKNKIFFFARFIAQKWRQTARIYGCDFLAYFLFFSDGVSGSLLWVSCFGVIYVQPHLGLGEGKPLEVEQKTTSSLRDSTNTERHTRTVIARNEAICTLLILNSDFDANYYFIDSVTVFSIPQ